MRQYAPSGRPYLTGYNGAAHEGQPILRSGKCTMEMDDVHRVHFRNELRDARAVALRDAEGFDSILFAIERLGSFLLERIEALGEYQSVLIRLAQKSPLSHLPRPLHGWSPPFNRLLGQLVEARNDALHQGAFARHLTSHAMDVSLILEDALMDGSNKVGDYMVRNVITAALWQPLSFVRQQMLANSFSFLPVIDDSGQRPVKLSPIAHWPLTYALPARNVLPTR